MDEAVKWRNRLQSGEIRYYCTGHVPVFRLVSRIMRIGIISLKQPIKKIITVLDFKTK